MIVVQRLACLLTSVNINYRKYHRTYIMKLSFVFIDVMGIEISNHVLFLFTVIPVHLHDCKFQVLKLELLLSFLLATQLQPLILIFSVFTIFKLSYDVDVIYFYFFFFPLLFVLKIIP